MPTPDDLLPLPDQVVRPRTGHLPGMPPPSGYAAAMIAAEQIAADEACALAGLAAAQRLAHDVASRAGWYRDPRTGAPIERNVGEVIALMHSELSEALEAHRRGAMDDKLPERPGIEVEFADCIIRILDTAAALGLDVAGAVVAKNRFNRTRADHRPEARTAPGGKAY